jgi:hypothetical protein
MDPNGGMGPAGPRLDTNAQPQVAAPDFMVSNQTPLAMPGDLTGPQQQVAQGFDAQQATGLNIDQSPMAPVSSSFNEPPQNIQPDLLPPQQPPTDGKKVIVVAVISVIVCLVVGAAMFFVGVASGTSKGRAASDKIWQEKEAERQKKEEGNKDDSADVAEELELGELIDPQYLDETIEGEVGDQKASSDGFVMKVTNVERNFKTDDPNYKIDPSKELVKVNFIFGNTTKDKAKDITNFGFRLENSVNAKLVPENIAEYEDKFDTVKLDPGAQSKGSIVYLVNKDEKPLKFVREQVYRISGQNREVTTRVVITIVK